MRLPLPRGPLSAAVRDYLAGGAAGPLDHAVDAYADYAASATRSTADVCGDADLQLALAMLYELHFGGFDDVDDSREWDLSAVRAVQVLEPVFLEAVLGEARSLSASAATATSFEGSNGVAAQLQAVIAADHGPSLSLTLMKTGTLETVSDYVRQRSTYQLREADPHTFAIPRLRGRAKSALVEIQRDEYGEGQPGALHADLYAGMMRELGLDTEYGAYWDETLPEMFAVLNLMSAFAVSRRWRGALVGHLAAYEMTSSIPSRRLSNALRRVGASELARRYYDEHVEADAVHEQIAAHDLCGSLAKEEPELAGDIVLGAAACLVVEAHFATAMLARWEHAAAA
ncbi:MAG: iron-containing redox enzyme family protein [Actinomycetales bacterium]